MLPAAGGTAIKKEYVSTDCGEVAYGVSAAMDILRKKRAIGEISTGGSEGKGMGNSVDEKWEAFLNPDVMRPALITASLYIAAFQLLKDTIVDRPKGFFTNGFGANGIDLDPAYERDVLSLNKSPLYASLEWWKSIGTIDGADLATFERLKIIRNDLAHELPQFLTTGFPAELPTRFVELIELVDKLECWWVVNVELTTNPHFEDQEIDEAAIVTGTVMMLRAMMDIALGSDEQSKQYLKHFHKRQNGTI